MQTGIVLQVATNPTVDVSLKIGEVSEQVQVEANAALVETQATGVGNVMENQRIVELPLNGRVATDLIQYTAGAIPQGVAGNGGYPGTQQFVIAGGQAFGVAFWLDGSVYNNPWDLANMPLPFPDALQEFKVETSSLTAQNGVHAGGTVTGVTRSGSNGFHGDAVRVPAQRRFERAQLLRPYGAILSSATSLAAPSAVPWSRTSCFSSSAIRTP